MNEKVSVIVPVYKAETTVARCIEIIISQNDIDLELVLVDDGSPDRSGAVCDEYAEKDPRIKVIHKANAGVSAARNAGIEASSGDWIMFCDADDEILPGTIAEMLKEGGDADIVLGGFEAYIINKRRNRVSIMRDLKRDCFSLEKAEFTDGFFKFYQTNNILSSCAKLFRADIIRKNNIRFNTDLVVLEDYDFVLSFLPFCRKICSSSATVYLWYIFQESGTPYYAKRSRMDYADDVIAVHRKHQETLETMNVSDKGDVWSVWKDLYGNFGTALSALWAIPTETFGEKLAKLKRIRTVLRDPAYRAYVKFSRGEFSKKEYRYMKHPTMLSLFLLRREREKLGK
ncbi:MAG: glycosyltransferase family 2 protein [Clostridia bacterium]|nr:glycosyltransferase family 2 protein [Clostridia bacterium]